MTNYNDPFNPNTSVGQTAAGSLIHDQNEMLRRMNEENRAASEELQRGSPVPAGYRTANASDIGRRFILIGFVVGFGILIHQEYGSRPDGDTLLIAIGGAILGTYLLRKLLLTDPGVAFTRILSIGFGVAVLGAAACAAYYLAFLEFGAQGVVVLTGIIATPFVLILLARLSGWFFNETRVGIATFTALKIAFLFIALVTFIYVAAYLFP